MLNRKVALAVALIVVAAGLIAIGGAVAYKPGTGPRPDRETGGGAYSGQAEAAPGLTDRREYPARETLTARPDPGRAESIVAGSYHKDPEAWQPILADAGNEALRRRLAEPVSMNFIGCRLDYFLQVLGRNGKPEFRIEGTAGTDALKVTLAVEGMPLGAALRWVCRQARSAYRLENGEVVLAPGARVRMPAPPPDEAAKAWLAMARDILGSNVSFDLQDCDLDDALQVVFKTTGLNVILDRDVSRATRVMLMAHDEPLACVLEDLTRAGLEFALVDHALFVGSPQAVWEVAGEKPGFGGERSGDVF